jgi:hypothetical protein
MFYKNMPCIVELIEETKHLRTVLIKKIKEGDK